MNEDKNGREWFREWFNTPYYHLLYRQRDEEEASRFINSLLKTLDLPQGARILDLACGKGRHSICMAKSGYQVTGLDLSPASIEAASLCPQPGLEFYIHDMRYPFRINYYDAVLSLFSSFGYFDTERENRNALRWAIAALKPRGLFVLDFMNTRYVLENLVKEEHQKHKGVNFHISRTEASGYIQKDIKVVDQQQILHFHESVRAYQPGELITILESEGMQIDQLYADYDLNTFDPASSERFIVTARKIS